jgi:hypothetical protein
MNKTLIQLAVSSLLAVSLHAVAGDDKSLSIESMTEKTLAKKQVNSVATPSKKINAANSIKPNETIVDIKPVSKNVVEGKNIVNKEDLAKVKDDSSFLVDPKPKESLLPASQNVNPFSGQSYDKVEKNKKLSNLALDEQIVSKQLAIARLNNEIKNIGKPTTGMSFGNSMNSNLENNFDQAIKKKSSIAKAKPSTGNKDVVLSPPIAAPVVVAPPAVTGPTLLSIITSDDKRYATIKGRDGKVTVKSGDKFEGNIVLVNDDRVMIGSKVLLLNMQSNNYKNPDAQSVGEAAANAGVGGNKPFMGGSTTNIEFPQPIVSRPVPLG